MKYQSQKIALAYIYVALILFAVQVTMGLVIGYIYVNPNFLSEILPALLQNSACRGIHAAGLVE